MADKKLFSLSKHQVPKLLEKLMAVGTEVWGAQAGRDQDTYFGCIDRPDQLARDYVNGFLGAKRYAFPQVEELFRFARDGKLLKLSESGAGGPAVIWGIRPCDMSAINYFDSFFGLDTAAGPDWKSGDPLPDPLYRRRRDRALFVALGCNKAGPKCFCVCTDSGPFLAKGYDLQLCDLGDYYLVEVGSPKGERFVEDHKDFLGAASAEDASRRRALERESGKTFQEPVSFFAKAMRRLDQGKVDQALWQKVGKYCIGCGGCIYACPMCSCFDVDDVELSESEGARVRAWDTCDFAGFTREVSGHNPRPSRADRRKRWFYHKISMDYLEKNPAIGCVGCGRCVIACPGGVDMATVVRWMRKA